MQAEGNATVAPRGEARIKAGHPWIFRSDVSSVTKAAAGGVVRVLNARGKALGFAFFSDRSEIRLRMIERGETLSPTLLRDRLQSAIAWRERIAPGAEACRLVHGEGDLLPSLVVDRYGDYLVIQTLSQSTDRFKPQIVEALSELLSPRGILERNDPRVRALEGLDQQIGLLQGEVPETVLVKEGSISLVADLWRGQKTGMFLDQRENHVMAREYARGRVLDCFTYDGGFALQVAQVADEVVAVDISADSLARVKSNAERNGITNLTTRDANVFDLLKSMDQAGERFDTVILDPPAFAKSKSAIEKAARGYKEINLRALKLLRPGGVLITCSCSYHIHEHDLEQILASAAMDAGCSVTVVEKRRQSRDHPVTLGVPETYYLKCFVLKVGVGASQSPDRGGGKAPTPPPER